MTNNAITTSILNSESILSEKKKLIAKLELKNREILREIKRLRIQQESNRSLDENYLNIGTSVSRESTPLTINSNHTTKSLLNHQYLLNYQTYGSQQHQQPNLIAELKSLKLRKGELDSRIQILEHNRDELLSQLSTLDNVMKNMKTSSLSTRSTPIRSPFDHAPSSRFPATQQIGRGVGGMSSSTIGSLSTSPYNDSLIQLLQTTYRAANNNNSPVIQSPTNNFNLYQQQQLIQNKSSSLPGTPAMNDYYYNCNYTKYNPQFGYGSGQETISSSCSSNANARNLRNDLLIAADSVANAMHCLVKELNSGKFFKTHQN